MSRAVPEWIGQTDDAPAPARVKLRVYDRHSGHCASCARKLGVAGEQIEYDHITALILGGENRESNLQALCPGCHRSKTTADVALKSTIARKRAKALGLAKPRKTLPGGKRGKWKAKIGGGWEARDAGTDRP
jgi:5-methylcytosine-specific restriction protein A